METQSERTPRVEPRFFRDYCEGISTAVDGFRFLCRYPSLWQYGVWAVLMNVVVAFASLLITFYVGTISWNSFTTTLPIAWWAPLVEWTGFFAILALAIGTGLLCYVLLQGVFCGWAFSKLAYQVELFLGADPDELKEIAITAQILDALRASAKLIIINVAMLLLNLIPIAGSVVAVALGYYMNALILGAEFIGYPQELRGTRWKHRQEFARQWRPSTLGLGTIVAGLMLIPIVGALFQTTAVVGAVLLCRRINGSPDTPPPSTVPDEEP